MWASVAVPQNGARSNRIAALTPMSVRVILLRVRRGGRYTAAATSRETNDGVDPALANELELLAQEAEAQWSSSFLIEPRAFVAYLTARLAPGAQDVEAMRGHAADLYLACGCALGIPEAVRIFEASLATNIAAALRHMHLQPSVIDEIHQMTREKLIVGSAEGAPRIAEYIGRGTLRGWTRVVLTRIALNALRDQRNDLPLEAALLDQPAADTSDPELAYLRNRFGFAFDRAFEHAMRLLTTDERVLLQQRFVDGLTTEQLARFHRKHRTTMARQLHAILGALRVRTERFLVGEVGCGHSTAVSIVNLALSQTRVSIRRYLAPMSERRGKPWSA
jgi:RNA polymerase sigma-70 factor (ECF subfamily)